MKIRFSNGMYEGYFDEKLQIDSQFGIGRKYICDKLPFTMKAKLVLSTMWKMFENEMFWLR